MEKETVILYLQFAGTLCETGTGEDAYQLSDYSH